MTNSVSDPEMALFPSRGVLRGFSGCDVQTVRLAANPCAALLAEKITHFWIGNITVLKIEQSRNEIFQADFTLCLPSFLPRSSG